MNKAILLALAQYDAAMNDVVFETAEHLSEAELDQASAIRDSIRRLLLHLLFSKPFFVTACQGRSLDWNRDQLQTASAIRAFARRASEEAQVYIESLDGAELVRVVEIKLRDHLYRLPIWQLLLQAFMHSAQHRGELSTLMTNLGHPLALHDILEQFMNESGQRLVEAKT